MKLVVDVGNSAIKWATLGDDQLSGHAFADYGVARMSDVLDAHWLERQTPDAVFAASVAGAVVDDAITRWVQVNWDIDVDWIETSGECCGVTNAYAEPAQLGVDRWLAIIAAWHRVGGKVCVVDCGTAITIDGVDADGRHIGGAIAPGARMMRNALFGTAGIHATATGGSEFPATDTGEAVRIGSDYAVAGFVDRGLAAIQQQLQGDVRCIITGGGAAQLAAMPGEQFELVPDLVLRGIAIVIKAKP